MDNKTIAILAAAAIAIIMFKPDLLSNLSKNTQSGSGGGGTVIVPPVLAQHSTYYDVNVGAPTFPEPSLGIFNQDIVTDTGGNISGPGGGGSVSGFTAGPMQPAAIYEQTGSYDQPTDEPWAAGPMQGMI